MTKRVTQGAGLYGLSAIVLTMGLIACSSEQSPEGAQATPPTQSPVTKNVSATADTKKEEAPLDLSVQRDSSFTPDESERFTHDKKLPNLFESKEEEQNVSVSGKPIMDATNPDYVDAVEGAEISVDVKIP